MLLTVPAPVPALVTVRVCDTVRLNVAVTFLSAFIVTCPFEVSPLHPAKVEPASGVAVRVTAVPAVKLAPQVAPQSIPAGVLVTVPMPVPALVTVRVYVIRLVVNSTSAP